MSESLDHFIRDAMQQHDGDGSSADVSSLPGHAIDGLVARGGMGAIYRARREGLEREVAVKVMTARAESPAMAERFRREALVLARLEHPNIVPIHELGTDAEGRLFYTMKLVKGRTLEAILHDLREGDEATLRAHSLASLLTIFRKVCDALAFAHSQGVLHRDLKPENVMIGEFGEVLVMDWGLAKMLNDECQMPNVEATSDPSCVIRHASFHRTVQGAVMGTPQYMSPEQAQGRIDELDERSDIFSLGGILYAILTLRPPVEGSTLAEVLEKVRSARVTPFDGGMRPPGALSNACAEGDSTLLAEKRARRSRSTMHLPGERIPPALSAVAMKALTLDKARRYQDVAAFSADIEAYQNGFATSAEHAGLGKQLVLLIRRNKGIFTTAAAAWLLITALAGWFVFHLRAKEQRATQAEAIAVQEKETARQALAKSQLDLAETEFGLGKFVEAQKILEETPESFRDAHWRFLRAHSRDFTAQLSVPGKGAVNRLQVLPQGDRFAVRCVRNAIGIFSLAGQQIGEWVPVGGYAWGTFGIDRAGGRMAFAASANEVAVQEVATGQLVRRWTCELSEIRVVLLSPDGGTVLAAGGKQLIAYATQTGAPLWTQPFNDVVPAFSPDGRTVAVLAAREGLDLKVQLLDPVTGAVHSTLEASADSPTMTTLQFNHTSDQLACLGGAEVILWDTRTAKKIRALHFPGEMVYLLSPAGDAVATGSGNRIHLRDTATGRLLRSFNGASKTIKDIAFSPDGKTLLSSHVAAGDGIVHVWPLRIGEEVASARPGGFQGRRVVFVRDGSGFYACARNAGAWETQSGRETWKFPTEQNHLHDMAVHPTDGSILLSELHKQTFTRVSSTGAALEAFGTSANSSLKFNRSGQFLLAVDQAFSQIDPGSALRVMEYPSGKVLRKITFEAHSQPFAAFCLGDAAVATAALAGGITVWDWQAGTPLRQIAAAQTGSIDCLAASPDGQHLATGGPDRWIRVWEAATGRLKAAFRAHWESVRCVKFSPDGREILSGSEAGSVRLHDAATGEERLAFYGNTTLVADVDMSADGTRIAAITTDGFTKVWDRQLSSAAALPPKVVTEVGRVAAASPAAKKSPPAAPAPALPNAADGWEDLLARLTPAEVEKTGRGWSLKDGELFSPDTKDHATLPLPGAVSGISYQVRVRLRRLAGKKFFHLILPVADRMTGFDLDGFPRDGFYTGLVRVNGKAGKDLPGAVHGEQVKDTKPHDLEVTVRLDGANATITATLDGKPLYEWTGPTAALSQDKYFASTQPGALAFGTYAGGWAVSEVKVKRLKAGK